MEKNIELLDDEMLEKVAGGAEGEYKVIIHLVSSYLQPINPPKGSGTVLVAPYSVEVYVDNVFSEEFSIRNDSFSNEVIDPYIRLHGSSGKKTVRAIVNGKYVYQYLVDFDELKVFTIYDGAPLNLI